MFIGINNLIKQTFIIFIEYLIKLLETNNDAYKNDIVKINISIIITFIFNKYSKDIVNSREYFYLCIKELQNIYENENINQKLSKLWKNKYNSLKISLLRLIGNWCTSNYNLFEENNNYKELLQELKNKKISEENIDNYIKKYNNIIDIFIKIKLREQGYSDKNLNELKKTLFLLDDIDEIFSYILTSEGITISDLIIDCMNKDSINFNSIKMNLEKDIKEIISSEEFYKKLKDILESKRVKDFFNFKRNFSKNEYETDIISNENDNKQCDIDLKCSFNIFMDKFKDRNWFLNIIKFKWLPRGIRAYVDKNLRIFINPLFISFTEELFNEKKNNSEIIKEILTSYLLIIIIHEMINLLKYIKDGNLEHSYESYFDLPDTPKGKEGGKFFIYYLFNTPVINKINYYQAKLINDTSNWEDINKLYQIFDKEEIKKNEKKNDKSTYYAIKFYLSKSNISDKGKKMNDWYDFN